MYPPRYLLTYIQYSLYAQILYIIEYGPLAYLGEFALAHLFKLVTAYIGALSKANILANYSTNIFKQFIYTKISS